MLDFDYIIFCIMLIFLFCLLIITSIYIDFNTLTRWLTSQDMENRQSSCNNQDLDLETCDNSMVSSSPTSDLPPSYENCVLESQPPSYSSVIIYSQSHTSFELSADWIQWTNSWLQNIKINTIKK